MSIHFGMALAATSDCGLRSEMQTPNGNGHGEIPGINAERGMQNAERKATDSRRDPFDSAALRSG